MAYRNDVVAPDAGAGVHQHHVGPVPDRVHGGDQASQAAGVQVRHLRPSGSAAGQPHADRAGFGDVVDRGPRLDHLHDRTARLQAEQQVQVRQPHVGVHGDHLESRRGQVNGEVAREDRFPGAALAAGDTDDDRPRTWSRPLVGDEGQILRLRRHGGERRRAEVVQSAPEPPPGQRDALKKTASRVRAFVARSARTRPAPRPSEIRTFPEEPDGWEES